jgi:H+/Cl- antiporter ClcA
LLQKYIPDAPSRACAGGILLMSLVYLSQGYAYIGLGTDGMVAALSSAQFVGGWAIKWIFTLITLSVGFKGGEVTPLFFIGAMLGNAIAQWCGLPLDWCAALGLVAIFAGATHTPIASIFLAIELFGAATLPYAALACSSAYLCAGAVGIYRPKQ